jgi:hypothetical protein
MAVQNPPVKGGFEPPVMSFSAVVLMVSGVSFVAVSAKSVSFCGLVPFCCMAVGSVETIR